MSDLRLETPLSMEEIEENFKDFDLFSSMEEGLEVALSHQRGEEVPDLVVHERTLPEADAKKVRKSFSFIRYISAAVLDISCRTVDLCGSLISSIHHLLR